MDNVIAEYQKWKQQGQTIRAQARQAMEARFHDLLTEAARIAQEFQADFGSTLKPPPQVTAFRYKAPAQKGKKAAPGAAAVPPAKVDKPAPNPKVKALEKRLGQERAKLEAAKAAGKPTRNLEDRIYELEDEMRLAVQNG